MDTTKEAFNTRIEASDKQATEWAAQMLCNKKQHDKRQADLQAKLQNQRAVRAELVKDRDNAPTRAELEAEMARMVADPADSDADAGPADEPKRGKDASKDSGYAVCYLALPSNQGFFCHQLTNLFSPGLSRNAVTYTEHAKRKTVTSLDVVYALERQGRTLYGFGG
ncbi:hypothetical protein B0H65DRAFT_180238 [Neurospora tetraspora]|uniref:Histone H4 n=1 Tax=Neurospora tetraspora TaxID=94610 RepID=A0AAE0JF88_9PEZI|nr:hypothetical protein B0H65DRAFT_180238 [Neurospora tetraspora]